ncbi:MAG TPA: beta galactosidase jelly roll domain-containing protein [Terriglobia bacterium]|nr:beta galactosidase jelly roll domain-containing protein [Terriglobia bacterium]
MDFKAFQIRNAILLLIIAVASSFAAPSNADLSQPGASVTLRQGWQIQSSAKVGEAGGVILTAGYRPSGWYSTTMPTTVLAALVAAKVYPDPDYGMNLRSIPGTSYPIGGNFSQDAMPPDSPFRAGWWYRTQFTIPAGAQGKQLWLRFNGINNSANVWLNGHQVADTHRVTGMYRTYEFNVTADAAPGAVNTLAVEVFAPTPNDLSITFVDWNPLPPDKDMGIFRNVYLASSGPVTLRDPQVVTKFDLPSLDVAHLTVAADVQNATDHAVGGTLKGAMGGIAFSKSIVLAAHERRRVTFTPDSYPQLNVSHPRLWWPWQYGAQNLYHMRLEFDAGGQVSDVANVSFGIREITSELDAENHRVFSINGKRILIRGGGWSPDMMLRPFPEKVETEIRYARDMNLNTIRLEGKLMNDRFYNLCDHYGVLVIAGWCCCSRWERWKQWTPQNYETAGESLRSQVRLLRNHPCVLAFLYGSDNAPPAQAEAVYLKVFKEEHWPNPVVASAASRKTAGAGWTGVKMTGPYQYVAPSYWYEDHERGGAFGFNTETSSGPAIPVLASLKEFLPADHLWPVDNVWNDHAGGGAFKNLGYYNQALNERYGKSNNISDYAEKAQVMDYEGERAMFEAFGRNKYTSTGVIQWMLNNAWPSMIWHLFDYYLRPGEGYFGAKKACEPLHIQYSYDNQSIVVVNSTLRTYPDVTASAAVYDLNLKQRFSKEVKLDIPADSSNVAFALPALSKLSKTYFVRLALRNKEGEIVSRNFYWLSTKPDVSNWTASTWYYTPLSGYAHLAGLEKLPKVTLRASLQKQNAGNTAQDVVTVENPSSHLAFFIHLTVLKGSEDVHPVFWQDNDFELMPGERRQISATYSQSELGGAGPAIRVTGWNVRPQMVH